MRLAPDATDALPVKRRCGSCDLCCTAMGVEEVPGVPNGDKRPGVRCPHLSGEPGHSCTIYKDRPYPCQQFICLWRGSDTLLPDNLHPARVGFVIAPGGNFGEWPCVLCVHPDPAHPDSWKAPRHRALFLSLAKKFNAIVVIGQGELARHMFSPKGNEFSRERYPELFRENGKRIGLPDFEFLEHHLSKLELVQLLFSVTPPHS
jgi:hypothetical protein